MSPLHRFHPILRLFTLLLIGALLSGCQAITAIPQAPVAQGPASSTAPAASPSPSADASPSGMPSTEATAGTAESSNLASTAVPAANASSSPPTSTTTRPAANGLATLASLSANLLPDRDQVELAFEYGRTTSKERVARTGPLDVTVGDKQQFNLTNPATDENYTVDTTLVLALDRVLMYVQDGVDVDPRAVERSARLFNDKIYPRTRELFGSEAIPGVDGDPRLTVVNVELQGAGGYFSESDAVPKSVNRFSNERDMFVMGINSYPLGTEGYAATLAHEFQHMIKWNESDRTSAWFNEGMSQLAEELNGYADKGSGTIASYLANPDLQLTAWPNTPQTAAPHYGAAYLFLTYFYEQYGNSLELKRLIQANAGEQLHVLADIARQQNPSINTFSDLYADWAIANLLNAKRIGEGRYAYTQLPTTVNVEQLSGTINEMVAQFGTDYYGIGPASNERTVRFDGSDTIGVVTAKPEGNAMWWSNRGDSTHTTLERRLDLRNVESATLQFRLWHDIEYGYDYGFVSVSTDGGTSFTTLPGRYTTTDDPQGVNWGNGYTGRSGVEHEPKGEEQTGEQPKWLDEQIDLTPYTGKEIVLRFSLMTDGAYNAPGMVVDNMQVPEIGFSDDVETASTGWNAQGFTRTNNQLPQQWEVRIVRVTGKAVRIEPLTLDAKQVGEFRIAPNERAAVVVMGTTPHTTERASYQLRLMQP